MTSSSPSAVHFGHNLAGVQDMVIASLSVRLAEIQLVTRYFPMIKILGNFEIERFYIILWFEANCNLTASGWAELSYSNPMNSIFLLRNNMGAGGIRMQSCSVLTNRCDTAI